MKVGFWQRFERVQPWVIVGLSALLLMIFVAVAFVLFDDYELRVANLTTGVHRTSPVAAAHVANRKTAELLTHIGEATLGVLALAILIPRGEERRWFLWSGWLGFIVGAAFAILALFQLASAMMLSDDGFILHMNSDPAFAVGMWGRRYGHLLASAAAASVAICSFAIGIRWLRAAIVATFRYLRRPAPGDA